MPRIVLDLFCCAGGAGKGYLNLGVDVVIGVDKSPQPRYAGTHFVQADCIAWLRELLVKGEIEVPGFGILRLAEVAFFHASPPCQAHSDLQKQSKIQYEDLIAPTRWLLAMTGKPWVIENVEGAPLVNPVWVCGANDDAFPQLRVIRHRQFESNMPLVGVPCPDKHPLVFTYDKRKAHKGKLDQDHPDTYVQVTGGGNAKVANKKRAMGIDWMIGEELNEAIPPVYTEFIGTQILDWIDNHQKEEQIRHGITQAEAR